MTLTLLIQDTTHSETYRGITSFVGEDSSGSFGLLPGHTRMMTSLVMGLSRFKVGTQKWQYIAATRALLYFDQNRLVLSARHFIIDSDYVRISTLLEEQLLEEERLLSQQNQSLRRMEEGVLKGLWDMSRTGA
ncbi:MAG: F0F1 ATP synthase subunit epsilon [Pseudomonadota bacterium]